MFELSERQSMEHSSTARLCSKIIKDENGFSSLSVVVSLLITLALIFSTAQVYRVNSESAKIQNVADASVQAAESVVAEFMVLVRVADSVILSLGLTAIVASAIGVVCLCTPVTAEASAKIFEFVNKVIEARDKFADKSAQALNKIQNALPYLSAVKAFQVAASNNGGVMKANYLAIAILQPGEGVTIEPGNISEVKDAVNDIEANSDEMRESAAEAERLAQDAQSSKYEAWMADCGAYPNYCMAERARSKAYLDGSSNPLYKSVDTWNFGVAVLRTRAYYKARLSTDTPTSSGVEAQADWELRQHYYRFALKLANKNYYYDNGDSVDMNFEHIPSSNTEMQGSELFTQIQFPVTQGSERLCMHAYRGCPNCTSVVGWDTAQNWNSSDYEICPLCKFSQSHFGSVASATSHNPSGFEYHYRIVEEQSKIYQEAKNKATPVNNKIKNRASNWFNVLKSLLEKIGNKRIYAKPPGSYGAIVLVVNTASSPASSGFESSFVTTDAVLGARAAISGATIIEETSSEGSSVLSSILSGLKDSMPGVAGVGGVILSAWSNLLFFYNKGSASILEGIKKGLNSFSFNSASGLGTWASKALSGLMQSVGLEPANINALKPVLINTWHVARSGTNVNPQTSMGKISKTFATRFLTIREGAVKIQNATNSLLSGLANAEEIAGLLNLQAAGDTNGAFEVATITPLGDWGPSIPIRITLPKAAASTISNVINGLTSSIRSVLGGFNGDKIWR